MRNAFYKTFRGAEAALSELPDEVQAEARAEIDFHSLTLLSSHDSQIDGATKLLFATHDGLQIETVILRVASGRTALCLSSQVGCAAACVFCATGKLGIRRNLEAHEILDQVVVANQILVPEGRRVRNIVFMGMGEPFHNEDALFESLAVLENPKCFDHSLALLTVSTVGIPEAMERCARQFPRVNQALSLHSARQDVRAELIPFARRHDLSELREAVAAVSALQGGHTVMIEYLMLAGVNDRPADLAALAAWLDGLRVHVNLIPFNAIGDDSGLEPTAKAEREALGAELKRRGFVVTLRRSLGVDVTAACGQLIRRENLREKR